MTYFRFNKFDLVSNMKYKKIKVFTQFNKIPSWYCNKNFPRVIHPHPPYFKLHV